MVVHFSEVELYRRANLLVEKEEFNRACKIYRKLEEMYPEDWRYSNMLGYCYVHMQHYDEGRVAFQSALEKNGLQSTIFNNIAWAFNEEERYEEAFSLLNSIVSSYELDPYLQFNLGNALYGLKRYEEAIDAFLQTLSLNQYFIQCYFSLGLCYYRLFQYKEAMVYFERTLREEKNPHPDIDYFLSKCYFFTGELEKHLEMVDYLLLKDEDDIEIIMDRVKSLIQLQRVREAIDDLDYVLFLDEEHEEAGALLHYLESPKVNS